MEEAMTASLLAKLLRSGLEQEIPKEENLRYVIYLRKSTDEKGKQVRSIEDQLDACQQYASSNNLLVVGEPLV